MRLPPEVPLRSPRYAAGHSRPVPERAVKRARLRDAQRMRDFRDGLRGVRETGDS